MYQQAFTEAISLNTVTQLKKKRRYSNSVTTVLKPAFIPHRPMEDVAPSSSYRLNDRLSENGRSEFHHVSLDEIIYIPLASSARDDTGKKLFQGPSDGANHACKTTPNHRNKV